MKIIRKLINTTCNVCFIKKYKYFLGSDELEINETDNQLVVQVYSFLNSQIGVRDKYVIRIYTTDFLTK